LRGQLRKIGIVITDLPKKNNKNIKLIDYSEWAEGKEDEFWKVEKFLGK